MNRSALLEIAREFRAARDLPIGDELIGHCAQESAALVEHLAELGIDAELVGGHCDLDSLDAASFDRLYKTVTHVWVEVDDLIIDLTAGQFGEYPDVLIVPTSSPAYQRRIAGASLWIKAGAFWPVEQRITITPFVAAIWRGTKLQATPAALLAAMGL